jgi:hypothetical protein
MSKSVEPQWHKSRHSASEGSCVEVAEGPVTLVRDTQNRDLGHLGFAAGEWAAFLADLKRD